VSKVQNEVGEKADHAARRIVTSVIVRLLAFVVALSFLATLLPLANVSAASSTMACCIGKKEEESHCHASAKAKKAAAHDHSTDSSKPAFKSAFKARCSDCCACSVANQQQKRERGTAQPVARLTSPLAVPSRYASRNLVLSSNDVWAQISPRGPPAFLL
jgi:hypothetical protein